MKGNDMNAAMKTLKDKGFRFDCSPRYESIVGQRYIGSMWVHASKPKSIYHVTFSKQSEKGSEDGPGWIEDGYAMKGETISENAFFSYIEAKAWYDAEVERLMLEIFGGFDDTSMAP